MSNSLRLHGLCLPSSSVCGILQATILEWVAISLSRGSSHLRDWTHVSSISWTGRWVLCHQSPLGSPLEPQGLPIKTIMMSLPLGWMDTSFFVFPMGGKQHFRSFVTKSTLNSAHWFSALFRQVLFWGPGTGERTAPYGDDDAHAGVLGAQQCGLPRGPWDKPLIDTWSLANRITARSVPASLSEFRALKSGRVSAPQL